MTAAAGRPPPSARAPRNGTRRVVLRRPFHGDYEPRDPGWTAEVAHAAVPGHYTRVVTYRE